jgi:predicted PurR-regulated permease PerM
VEAPSRFQTRTFGVLLTVAAFFCLWTVSPIWVPCFLGVLLAVIAAPLQRRLERRFHGHPRLLAAAITVVTVAVGVGLLVGVGILVVREVIHFLTDLAPRLARSGIAWITSPHARAMLTRVGSSPEQLQTQLGQHSAQLASHLTALLGSLLSVTSHGFVTLVFTSITSYYLLIERRGLVDLIVRLLPLPPEQTRALIHEFHVAVVGTVLGVGVIALVQGVFATIGFAIFRVDTPLVWGALTAIASLIPAVGTALTCVTIAVVLMFSHRIGAGLGVLLWWALLVVGVCDYVFRPRLMQGRMRLHSLLVLIALFGGIEAFGPLGVVLGPLSVALFVALLRLYERSYRPPHTLRPRIQ